MTHCNVHSQVKIYEQKGFLCDSLYHTTASMMKIFLFFPLINYILWGREAAREDGRYEGMHDVKDTKNKKKVLKKQMYILSYCSSAMAAYHGSHGLTPLKL